MLRFLIAVFMLSGFSGLIYESIWTHYLRLFLGHAAYAQTLVLVIFLGGLAAGSAYSAKKVDGWSGLIARYAIIEGLIGIIALLFDPLFTFATTTAYEQLLPALAGSPAAIHTAKYTLASLLILPQSVLLGMTFPLMVGGVLRQYPGEDRNISRFYFANSFGAVLGVLCSTFVLIGALGLPGTVMFAGLINIMLAMLVWLAMQRCEEDLPPAAATSAEMSVDAEKTADPVITGLLLVTLLTGFSSFLYEIGWIRMLTQVMGSSTHSFEVMLGVFIAGLAGGSFWLSRHGHWISRPWTALAIAQIVMGIGALMSVWVYIASFDMMEWFLQTVQRNVDTYSLYLLFCGLIAVVIMLPATFCAGMTLPLATQLMLRTRYGQRGIGMVYALNTFGAIAAIILATHVLMPTTGLKAIIVIGAVIDMVLGIVILSRAATTGEGAGPVRPQALAAMLVVTVGVVVMSSEWDVRKLTSGVFRSGKLETDVEVPFYRDGKTATIAVRDTQLETGGYYRSIFTNGKPEASINYETSGVKSRDEMSQMLTGALPLILDPSIRTAAMIGMGSGMSSSTVLLSDRLRSLDTIEIERAVIDAAELFRPHSALVYDDARSSIHVDDAKTFFSVNQRRYDAIISEPSNPWVSGVATLFSREFYAHIRDYLNEGGLFVQWMHMYELSPEQVAMVFNALSTEFEDYVIYSMNSLNVLIIARADTEVPAPDADAWEMDSLRETLDSYGIDSIEDIQARRVGDKQTMQGLFATYSDAVNSDFFPLLDIGAARSRYARLNAAELVRPNRYNAFPLRRLVWQRQIDPDAVSVSEHEPMTIAYHAALGLHAYFTQRSTPVLRRDVDGNEWNRWNTVTVTQRLLQACDDAFAGLLNQYLFSIVADTLPYLDDARMLEVLAAVDAGGCSVTGLDERMAVYRGIVGRDWQQVHTNSARLLSAEPVMPDGQLRFFVSAWLYSGSHMPGFDIETAWSSVADRLDSLDALTRMVLLQVGRG